MNTDQDINQRPTAPVNSGWVPRFGMYAGPNYAGGHALREGELPDATVWRVPPVGYLDDITRNHDANYTYIEQTYQGTDAPGRQAKTQALWQADKEMLGAMLHHQPSNWLEAQYRSAAIQAFVAKADMSYRPAVDVVGDWNRELADIDPKFPAMEVNDQGRATWNPFGLNHAGGTYTKSGMEALSTSDVNSQVAVMFNEHIKPGNIATQEVPSYGEIYDPIAERDFSRRLFIPQRDPQNPSVFTAEGSIDGKEVQIWYHSGDNRLIRTVSSNGQIESQTTYDGTPAAGPAGDRYKHADFTVIQQKYKNGQPDGDQVTLPPVKASVVPNIEGQESAHTTAIKAEVVKGKGAQYPSAPTEADKAWHAGQVAKPAQTDAAPKPTTESRHGNTESSVAELPPAALRLLADSEHHVRALADKHGLSWDRGMDNTVAAIARQAQADGLSQVDHLVVKEGQIRYASYDGVVMKEGSTPARAAANMPSTQSLAELAKRADSPEQVANHTQAHAAAQPEDARARA